MFKRLSPLLKPLTEERYCLLCHKRIVTDDFNEFVTSPTICPKCLTQTNPIFENFKTLGHKCLAIYRYASPQKEWLLGYKEQLDYALKDVFFTPYLSFIKTRFYGYSLVVAPSSKEAIERRGFSHMYELAKTIGLPILDVLYKEGEYSQKGQSAFKRRINDSFIKIKNVELVKNKKILLLDDVYTTGTTFKACLSELAKGKPRKISGLVLMKV